MMTLISLSGTPGVGKTKAAEILKKRGHEVLNLNELAEDNDFVVGHDESRDSKIIDLEALNLFIAGKYLNRDIIIEGHLAHLITADMIIILRCDPKKLEERLSAKGWSKAKIKENVGAEILDVIKVEAYEIMEKVYEIDTTQKSPSNVALEIEGIIKGDYTEPNINWLDRYEFMLFDIKSSEP